MEFEPYEIVSRRLAAYCCVNAYDLAGLKENLEQPGNEKFQAIFKRELADVVAGKTINRQEYERLTDQDFDTDDEYLEFIAGVYAYLYENGPLI